MMIGDQIRPMDYHLFEDPTAYVQYSPSTHNVDSQCEKEMAALQHYLDEDRDSGFPVDAFSSDNFRMFEFKVNKCSRVRSHDWTECPFAHPGEKARRRDPRKYHYAGIPCPDFRKGGGDACEYAHGVFECWLHPARYRTQPCKDGTRCRRRICFFAHTPHQLRVLPKSPVYSPPLSPKAICPPSQLAESVRCKKSNTSPPSRGLHMGIRVGSRSGGPIQRAFDIWGASWEEGPVMERVESGRQLRERIYAKLSKENSMDRVEIPDFGWVSELVR